jgi:hypothetical protein
MRLIRLVAVCALLAGCDQAPQPESIKTVAAYSVPLRSDQERNEFLSVLRTAAGKDGMHVDAVSRQELEEMARSAPQSAMTIYAGVWKGSADDESVAIVMDQRDHLGQAWIMFSKGTDPKIATKFRERAMREILRRWPDTLSLPIMPTGAIPLYSDLIRTPKGYVVVPSAASKYATEPPRPLDSRVKPGHGE